MLRLSRDFIERLAGEIVAGYRGRGRNALMTDINRFARDYLGLTVRYADFLTDKTHILGMTALRAAKIDFGNGEHRFRGKTVYMDLSLKKRENLGVRNFTLAHECAHVALLSYESALKGRRDERDCSARCATLDRGHLFPGEEGFDWWEWQADVMASALLMPGGAVRELACSLGKTDRFVVSPGLGMHWKDEKTAREMAETFGVSYRAMAYRLKTLGMTITERKRDFYRRESLETVVRDYRR